jgi:hypothetical protein
MTAVKLALTHADATRFTNAVQEVSVLVNQAENVFALLALLIQEGDHAGHFGLHDMAALAGKALAGFGELQNEDLAKLSSHLRAALEQKDASP